MYTMDDNHLDPMCQFYFELLFILNLPCQRQVDFAVPSYPSIIKMFMRTRMHTHSKDAFCSHFFLFSFFLSILFSFLVHCMTH